jgi:hypothetical protein
MEDPKAFAGRSSKEGDSMNINKLLIVLLSQFTLISAFDMSEPPAMGSIHDSSGAVLESKKHDNGSVTQILQDALKVPESENQQEMGWRSHHPDLNTGISFIAGVVVGGAIVGLGLGAVGMMRWGLSDL